MAVKIKRLTKQEQDYLKLLLASGQFGQAELARMFEISAAAVNQFIKTHEVRTAQYPDRPVPPHHAKIFNMAAKYAVNKMPDVELPTDQLGMLDAQIAKVHAATLDWIPDAMTAMQYKQAVGALAQLIDMRDKLRAKEAATGATSNVMLVPHVMSPDEWEQVAVISQEALQRASLGEIQMSDIPPSSLAQYQGEIDKLSTTVEALSGHAAELRQLLDKHGISYEGITFEPEQVEVVHLDEDYDLEADSVALAQEQEMMAQALQQVEEQRKEAEAPVVATAQPKPWEMTDEQLARLSNLNITVR